MARDPTFWLAASVRTLTRRLALLEAQLAPLEQKVKEKEKAEEQREERAPSGAAVAPFCWNVDAPCFVLGWAAPVLSGARPKQVRFAEVLEELPEGSPSRSTSATTLSPPSPSSSLRQWQQQQLQCGSGGASSPEGRGSGVSDLALAAATVSEKTPAEEAVEKHPDFAKRRASGPASESEHEAMLLDYLDAQHSEEEESDYGSDQYGYVAEEPEAPRKEEEKEKKKKELVEKHVEAEATEEGGVRERRCCLHPAGSAYVPDFWKHARHSEGGSDGEALAESADYDSDGELSSESAVYDPERDDNRIEALQRWYREQEDDRYFHVC